MSNFDYLEDYIESIEGNKLKDLIESKICKLNEFDLIKIQKAKREGSYDKHRGMKLYRFNDYISKENIELLISQGWEFINYHKNSEK